jgi:hypothetical protein
VFDQYKVAKTPCHVGWLCNSNGIFIVVVSSSLSSGVMSLQDSLWSLWDHGIIIYTKAVQFNLSLWHKCWKIFTISMSLSLSVSQLSCSTIAMCRFLQPSIISTHVLFSFPSLLLYMNWWISSTLYLILQFFLLTNSLYWVYFFLSRVYFLLHLTENFVKWYLLMWNIFTSGLQ